METKHTPINFDELIYYDNGSDFGEFIISTPRTEVWDGGREIAVVHQLDGESRQDAESRCKFILHALRAHDDMFAALSNAVTQLAANYEQAIRSGVRWPNERVNMTSAAQFMSERALAKARGEV